MSIQPGTLILVAVMNNPRDLEIARVLGWYRIPLRSAPKVIAVDYLAFYQTSAFGVEKQRVQYVAPVRGYELTTRAELFKDEPNHAHAHQEYYKIQLGSLERLEPGLPAGKWRRITFFYTTGEYFLEANSIDDLIVANEERQFLWQSLRERVSGDSRYRIQSIDRLDLPPEILAQLLGLNFSLPK
jgi:hypothetical protein